MTIHDGTRLKAVMEMHMPDGVTAMNIYYFSASFTESQTDAEVVTAVGEWMEMVYETVDEYISDLMSIGICTVYEFDGALSQWDKIGEVTPDITFVHVGEMLPHGVALMVRAYTTRARTIGRKYIPGLTEEASTDGAWTAPVLTAGALFGVAWSTVEVISAGNFIAPAVFSKLLEAVFVLSGEEVVLADPTYQRRRRPGVGI